ncbi:MAG: GWxTD domain-containing protein [Salinibacter sp.]
MLTLLATLVPYGGGLLTARAQESSPTPPSCHADEQPWSYRSILQSAVDSMQGDLRAASRAYLCAVVRLGEQTSTRSRQALLAHSFFLLPDSVRRAVAVRKGKRFHVREGGGKRLARWWRRQDPLIATPHNERVQEHLQRVAVALNRFSADNFRGFDARGEVFIRYGAPFERIVIDFRDHPRLQRMIPEMQGLFARDLTENVVWYYRFHTDSHYVFTKEDGAYQVGRTMDLLPLSVKHAPASGALEQRTKFLALAMRWIYNKLHHVHPQFRTQLLRLDSNVSPRGQSLGQRPVWNVLQGAVRDMNRAEQEIAKRRETEMPSQRTQIRDDVPSLPIALRTARSLRDDGTTQTHIYWGMLPDILDPPETVRQRIENASFSSRSHLLRVMTVRQSRDYRREAGRGRRYLVRLGEEGRLPAPKTYTTQGDTGLYHIEFQVEDLIVQTENGSISRSGPVVRSATHRFDSLRALSSDPSTLEMSDLTPLKVEDVAPPFDSTQVHPYAEFPIDRPLLLRFKIYHLSTDEQNRGRYTVHRRVERQTHREGIQRLLTSEERQQTTVTTQTRAQRSNVKESFLIPPDDWKNETTQQIQITIRVEDEVSGQSVRRTIDFNLVPPEERPTSPS